MNKRMLVMVIALAVFFGGLFGYKSFVAQQSQEAMAAAGPPVATVSTAHVRTEAWAEELSGVATLKSGQSVNISALLDGQITRLHFKSGDEVARGALLVSQDIAEDKAVLKALRADLRLAEIELGRIEQLVKNRLVPQSDLDVAKSKLDRVLAEIENREAAISKKSIRAPFAGRLGIRQVNLGQYLEAADAIVRLESLDSLYADFTLPQQAFRQVRVGQPVKLTVDAWVNESFTGKITAIEPLVDPATRNLLLRAELTNSDGRLQPGMFAQIRVSLPASNDVLIVPQAAAAFSPFGTSVFVVESSDTGPVARSVFITTGEVRGDLIEVTSGLSAGQQIVTAGQLKLRDGASIEIDNSVSVSSSETPAPDES